MKTQTTDNCIGRAEYTMAEADRIALMYRDSKRQSYAEFCNVCSLWHVWKDGDDER